MITDEMREKVARALCLSRSMPACKCTKETGCQAPLDNLIGEFGAHGRSADAALEAAIPVIRNAVLEEDAGRLRGAGSHQHWCATYGDILGWNDAEIHRLEPFMLRYCAEIADKIRALKTDAGNE